MNRIKLQLPLGPDNRLTRWANGIGAFYGHPVWLIGSQLQNKPNPSDVDIVCAIPNEEFSARYGDFNQWMQEGVTNIYSEVRWDWADDCLKRSIDGMKSTKLVIDFKIQPFAQFFGYAHIHKIFPPVQLCTRPKEKFKHDYFPFVKDIPDPEPEIQQEQNEVYFKTELPTFPKDSNILGLDIAGIDPKNYQKGVIFDSNPATFEKVMKDLDGNPISVLQQTPNMDESTDVPVDKPEKYWPTHKEDLNWAINNPPRYGENITS